MVADKGLENKATWSANHVSKELKTVGMSISVQFAMISIGRPYMPIGTYTVLFMLTKALDVIGLTAMAPNVKQLLNLSCDPSGG
jgi:hypothetical protein